MTEHTDQPIDLSGLDPTRDPQRFDVLVGNVMNNAATSLEKRRSENNVVGELARLRLPVLTAAAAAAVFLVFSLGDMPTQDAAADTTVGIAEAIGVPTEYAAWIRGETQPTLAEIYEGLAGQ